MKKFLKDDLVIYSVSMGYYIYSRTHSTCDDRKLVTLLDISFCYYKNLLENKFNVYSNPFDNAMYFNNKVDCQKTINYLTVDDNEINNVNEINNRNKISKRKIFIIDDYY